MEIFLELNVLLYAGVLAFVAGLGWTVTTWSRQIGDVLVLTILSTILAVFAVVATWLPRLPLPNFVCLATASRKHLPSARLVFSARA